MGRPKSRCVSIGTSGRGNGSSSGCALGTIGVRVGVGDGVNVTVGVCVGALVADGKRVIVGVLVLGGSGGGRVELPALVCRLSVRGGRLAA